MMKFLLGAIFTILFSVSSYSQCKSFTKKHCLPDLKPFVHNGQLTAGTVFAGEAIDVELSFSTGKTYRILVKGSDLLGDIHFQVLDKNKKVLFDNGKKEYKSYFDFKVENSQQLIIRIESVNYEMVGDILPSGCLSILVGFKE